MSKTSSGAAVLVDYRVGSGHLAPLLKKKGIPAQLGELDYGDVCIIGNGPEGPLTIGVEVKRVEETLSERFVGHQLPGLLKTYEVVWLMVQGDFRVSKEGHVKMPRRGGLKDPACGQLQFKAMAQWVLTMEIMGGLRAVYTRDEGHTVRMLCQLYHWWGKPWDEHHSHLEVYTGPGLVQGPEDRKAIRAPMSTLRKMLVGIDLIGYKRSADVERHFKTAWRMIDASEQEWMEIPGIGKKLAANIVGELRGRR